jgi:hypothetical protein
VRWLPALALLLIGCSFAPELPIHTLGEEFHAAAIEGRLVSRSGCLFLETAEGGLRGLAWPEGTVWNRETGELTVKGTTVSVGARVELGGSGIDVRQSLDRGDDLWLVPPAPQCFGDSFFTVGALEAVQTE